MSGCLHVCKMVYALFYCAVSHLKLITFYSSSKRAITGDIIWPISHVYYWRYYSCVQSCLFNIYPWVCNMGSFVIGKSNVHQNDNENITHVRPCMHVLRRTMCLTYTFNHHWFLRLELLLIFIFLLIILTIISSSLTAGLFWSSLSRKLKFWVLIPHNVSKLILYRWWLMEEGT